MNLFITVEITFDSCKEAENIAESLPKDSVGRSSVEVLSDNEKLFLNFKAPDIGALRASINSYLRLVKVATDVANITN